MIRTQSSFGSDIDVYKRQPSTYSLGVNAGFAIMIVLLAILLVLGFWSKLTNNSIMWFVVE